MTVTRKQCETCGGSGTVRRQRRNDPLDFRTSELCPTCGGSGSVPDAPARSGRQSGWLADMMDDGA